MGVKLAAASGGSVELVPTNTASNFTVTLPAATMTVVGTDTTQTLTNKTLTSPTLTTPNIDSAQVATVSGTALLYMCRAWVNFNGTGTVAIRASGNVSSITDNGTGDYTVNFTTAMADASYATVVASQGANTSNLSGEQTLYGTSTGGAQFVAPTASAFRVATWTSNLSGQADTAYVMAAVFR